MSTTTASGVSQRSRITIIDFTDSFDPDVVFQSSDDVHFRIHTKYLECNTGDLPTEANSNDTEIITLAENSKTLGLLFEFIHPRRHPSLDNEEFSTILAVAEAAEKYQVYSAMNYCQQCIRKHIPEHSSAVVAYAATHNYPYVLDGAATQALKIPLEEMVKMLPVNLVVPWTLYYQQWVAIGRKAVTLQVSGHVTCWKGGNGGQLCEWWPDQYAFPILDHIVNDITSLLNLDELFKIRAHRRNLGQGDCCTNDLKKWRSEIEQQLKGIKPFRDFL